MKTVLLTGATGFVGGHLLQGLLGRGLKVRCLLQERTPKRIKTLERIGAEIFPGGDIRRRESLLEASKGVNSVVHLVGIIREVRGATFEDIHVEGTRNIVECARESGVEKILHMSALGASAQGKTAYYRSKAAAERIVQESGLPYTIYRPAIILGPESKLLGTLRSLFRFAPVIPVPGGGRYPLAPVFIGDVVQAFLRGLEDRATDSKIFELCGPRVLSYREFLGLIRTLRGSRRPFLSIPMSLMKMMGQIFEKLPFPPPLTRDQMIMLEEGSVCQKGSAWESLAMKDLNPPEEALRRSL